jgi:two-component system KDP operon response regulator KdpE
MARRLLVIDDDVVFSRLLKLLLEKTGYKVVVANSGPEGLQQAFSWNPDLVILDIMMPEMNGWRVAQRLRDISDVPIIILTVADDEEDVVRGLRLGADDYIVKPSCKKEELLARIEAVLRRMGPPDDERKVEILDEGRFIFDPDRRQVSVNGRVVDLTPTEFNLLACLIHSADRVLSHESLLKEVWGTKHTKSAASLKQYIRYLRQKIEEDPANPRYIVTEWGFGYKFHTGKTD